MAADMTRLDAIEMDGLVRCCDSLQAALDNGHKNCQRKLYLAQQEMNGSQPCNVLYDVDLETALRSAGLYWGPDLAGYAASEEDLSALRYLHNSGCPWDSRTCASAAEAGSLECLRYAHEHGCPYDVGQTLEGALSSRSLSCLMYAHKTMDFAWSYFGIEAVQAYSTGNFEALRYICSCSTPLLLPHVQSRLNYHGLWTVGAYWNTRTRNLVSEQWCRDRAFCLLFLHAHSKGIDSLELDSESSAWTGLVGRTALKLMAAMRAAVREAFTLAGVARSNHESVNVAHRSMALVPLDIIEEILHAARLYQ